MTDPYQDQTPEGGEPLASDDPVLLQDPVVDALMRMVMEITAELWVERERRIALEDLLDRAGVVTADAVETYQPDQQRAAAIREQRDRLINGVFKEVRRLAQNA
jgi:hypothetical protein